ncbi:hypothetical protein APHAL10511_000568 [Amanita phalloides]|nr:hypothetical protein APHAL10511_000568 [Amanita phalloides]
METGMVDNAGTQWADEDGNRQWSNMMGDVEGMGGEVELQDAVGARSNVQAAEPKSPVQAMFLPMALS